MPPMNCFSYRIIPPKIENKSIKREKASVYCTASISVSARPGQHNYNTHNVYNVAPRVRKINV